MTVEITSEQQQLFQILLANQDAVEFQALVAQAAIESPMAMGTITFGLKHGWVRVEETTRQELVPAANVATLLQNGLPERQFLEILTEKSPLPMKTVAEKSREMGLKVNEIVKWGEARGWVEKNKGELHLTQLGQQARQQDDADEQALKIAIDPKRQAELQLALAQGRRFSPHYFLDELARDGIDSERVALLLKKRPELAKIKERTLRKIELTASGRNAIPQLVVRQDEQNQLTSEDIVSGAWEKIRMRRYNVTLPAETIAPKKCHPMQKIIQQARQAFLRMGFQEIVSPHVELGFWDFDALFQPQDHPSRDMQDTFYMKRPQQGRLPAKTIVANVRATHEDGGDTGSSGWGYRWDEKEAQRLVMRTHTTATSIRAIAADPNPPRKVFCVGRVFRNETISFKHLPEFHQIDGIVIDNQASFCSLLGTLQEFYHQMGFARVKFKPAFFPYTEPSAEVFVWMEQKCCWIELGGSGIFRPEVTRPFGCKVPVMAWGLGLERLAMLRYGINDIRILYGSDLDWLQEVRLCQ